MVLVQSGTCGKDRSWVAGERQTQAASVARATDVSNAPEKHLVKGLMAIFVCEAINTSGGWPWLLAWHPWDLVSMLWEC
jgi:hypothetical protein